MRILQELLENIVMGKNLQRSPPPGDTSVMLNEEWLEDDKSKYKNIIEKSSLLTCNGIAKHEDP